MSLDYAHGAIQWLAADAAAHTYTVSGLSFQPKAIRFSWMGLGSATDAVSASTHSRRGIGFAASPSDRRCVGSQDQDAAANAVCTTGYRADCVAMTLTSTPAADGLLDITSFAADGFVLTVDDQAPVDITVFWEAWGGSDISVAATLEIAEPAATGNQDYTVTGFVNGATDQVVMFAGCQATGAAPTAARNDSGVCVGFASGTAAANNVTLVGNSDDGSANMDTDVYGQTGECLAMITVGGGNPSARAALTVFGANNFRLNWIARATTGRKYIAMAIKGGQWAAGSYTIDGATLNATATISGLAFAPTGISLFSTPNPAFTAGVSVTFDEMSIGFGSSTASRRSQGYLSFDASANAQIDLTIQYDQVLSFVEAGALLLVYDINAMNSDGFQIINDLAGGVANEWHAYLAFGSAAATNALTAQVSAESSAFGGPTATGALAATAAAAASTTATLITLAPITANVSSEAQAVGGLTGLGTLAGTMTGAGEATGNLSATGALAAHVEGAASSQAQPSALGELTGRPQSDGSAVGSLSAVGALTGIVSAPAYTFGDISATGALAAQIYEEADATADLTAAAAAGAGVVTGQAFGISTLTGVLTGVGELSGQAFGVVTLTGEPFVLIPVGAFIQSGGPVSQVVGASKTQLRARTEEQLIATGGALAGGSKMQLRARVERRLR